MTNENCTKYTLRTLIFIIAFLLILLGSHSSFAGQTISRNLEADLIEGQSSSRNYIRNGGAEKNIKGWATYADAAGATPVNGTGGAPSVTLTRSTASPLINLASFVITKDAANRQGEGASYDFTLDSSVSGSNPQNMVLEFFYETAGTFVSGASSDLRVYLYDVTNSALITPQATFIGSSPNRFQTSFLPVSGAASYRLIFHVATTSAAAWTMKVDRVSIHDVPTTFNTSGVSTVATLTTGNGFGSTNTNIRRYSSTTTQGTAVTCTDSATLGTSCTINQDGLYTANRLDRNTAAPSNFGITKNDDCTVGGFDSVASSNQIAYTMAASNIAVNASDVGTAMVSGDVVRACDDSAAKTNDVTSRTSRLVIAKVRDEALPATFIVATGGTITTDGNYKVHTFNSSGTFQITSGSGTVASLVVGGGGGGGSFGNDGGGGAGGLVYTTPGSTYSTGSFTVTVGSGGAFGGAGLPGSNGGNSVFDTITATGGGGGGTLIASGGNGGSGGGGGYNNGTPGTGTGGQGNNGGQANTGAGSGGGGAGGAGIGAVGVNGGAGGVGLSNSITGVGTFYAGGGGGGTGTGGAGGNGGGGAGGTNVNGNAVAGTANTGGGGGGGGGSVGLATGASGGDGVTIVRYQFQ